MRDVVRPTPLLDHLALAHLEVERSIVVAVVEKADNRFAVRTAGSGEHFVPCGGNLFEFRKKAKVGQVACRDHGICLFRVENPQCAL